MLVSIFQGHSVHVVPPARPCSSVLRLRSWHREAQREQLGTWSCRTLEGSICFLSANYFLKIPMSPEPPPHPKRGQLPPSCQGLALSLTSPLPLSLLRPLLSSGTYVEALPLPTFLRCCLGRWPSFLNDRPHHQMDPDSPDWEHSHLILPGRILIRNMFTHEGSA